uniref:Uncharacterized protein n=1 Tax=Panagrolaimus davidi TaxID=227884 RepID=A0A914PXZ2_9BILA
MIHVDSLVGINQKGKFIHDIIPAVPMPEFSRMVKYTVKELVYNAIQEYYKFNSLPRCTKLESENYNPLANIDDGSCDDPKVLYSFGGIYQKCIPSYSWGAKFQDVEPGTQCKKYERRNRLTKDFSCPNKTNPILIDSTKIQFYDRIIKQTIRKCWWFLPYCWYELGDVIAMDEIFIATYWCMSSTDIPQDKVGPTKDNDLDSIMSRPILFAIDKVPKLLEACFPKSFNLGELMQKEEVCKSKEEKADKPTWKFIKDGFISKSIQQINPHNSKLLLNITSLQLDVIKDYPALLEALLPILHLKADVKNHPDLFKTVANNPLVLQQQQ